MSNKHGNTHRNDFEICPVCSTSPSNMRTDNLMNKIVVIILSAVLLLIGLIFEFLLGWEAVSEIIFIVIIIFAGYKMAREGIYKLILKRKLSIDFLITIAATGSLFIGHAEEGATVIFLFYIAESLEDYAVERARKSIQLLMELAPETATIKRNGEEKKIHVHEVEVGEIVVVRPGEKIPLDGVVVRGVSSVNQAPITGESIPVTKREGDEVYAGTINNEGFLEIRVTRRSDETVLSKIIRLIEEAQKTKSPVEKFIDKFSKYYTPSVIFLALSVAIIPTIIFGLPLNVWLYRALVLLVISCPCALAISTPIAMVSSITGAARNGVLIKGSAYVEEISKVKVFAFDKTGTLTEGNLEVTDIISLSYSKDNILAIAASLEKLSEHPIAKAIVQSAEKQKIMLESVNNFKAIPGKGVYGEINGKTYFIGNKRLFNKLQASFPTKIIENLEKDGKTVVLIGSNDRIIGLIAVMDKIRNTTISTIAKLKKNGIKTIMITGDNEGAARAVAKRIGIDEYKAELLPLDKVNIISELSEKYGHIAMIGDGVNDAPALAKANVGIVMGAIGSDVSLETADIALMQDDLSKLSYLIKLSKKTLEIVKENIFASILIKGSLAILAFPGLVSLWLAVAVGDMGLSLAVILNAMRLSLIKSDVIR